MRRVILSAMMLGLLWLSLGCALAGPATSEPTTASSEPLITVQTPEPELLPDFTLETLEGDALSLSDYRGQVVLVNFWASWCPACRAEIPDLERYYELHRDEGLVVIGVNVQEPSGVVSDFAADKGLTFPIVLDIKGTTTDLYGVTGLPTSFFVGRDGTSQGYWPGGVTVEMLEQGLTPLLQAP